MVRETAIIHNPTGLHLRPAGKLSTAASLYKASVRIRKGNRVADAKSLLALLGACIKSGDEVEFICEGEDEEEALRAVLAVLDSEEL